MFCKLPTYGWSRGQEWDGLGWVCKLYQKEGWGGSPGNNRRKTWALGTLRLPAPACPAAVALHTVLCVPELSIFTAPPSVPQLPAVSASLSSLSGSWLSSTALLGGSLPWSALLTRSHLLWLPSFRGHSPMLPLVVHCLRIDVSYILSHI